MLNKATFQGTKLTKQRIKENDKVKETDKTPNKF